MEKELFAQFTLLIVGSSNVLVSCRRKLKFQTHVMHIVMVTCWLSEKAVFIVQILVNCWVLFNR